MKQQPDLTSIVVGVFVIVPCVWAMTVLVGYGLRIGWELGR